MDERTIRMASGPADVDAICALDPIAEHDGGRRNTVARAVEAGHCAVCVVEGRIAGYVVWEYSFFEQGFVSLLIVARERRRQGLGRALMAHVEGLCRTPKLFTSTNLSNHPMQDLLARLRYTQAGVLHHLDEGDPEMVYVKHLGA